MIEVIIFDLDGTLVDSNEAHVAALDRAFRHFGKEFSLDDAEKSKPAPDIFEATLHKLDDPPPSTVLTVGDTPYDAKAAKKVGVATIALLCGGFTQEELRAAGAVAIYRDPADLLEHYEDSPLVAC